MEVMDGMKKFFKISSYISINSAFDNDDDYIHEHGEGGSDDGGGGDAEVLQICFIHISPLKF